MSCLTNSISSLLETFENIELPPRPLKPHPITSLIFLGSIDPPYLKSPSEPVKYSLSIVNTL